MKYYDYWNQQLGSTGIEQEISNWTQMLNGLCGSAGLGANGFYSGALADYQSEPDEEGWYEYSRHYPPDHVLLQFERRDSESHNQWIGYNDFDPAFNIAGLYWRWTGIGREQRGYDVWWTQESA